MYSQENLTRIKKLNALAPGGDAGVLGIRQVGRRRGRDSDEVQELIAVAVAMTTQCPYCIEIHTRNARRAGATDAELAEAAIVAAALRAGAAVTHATHALG